MTSKICHVTSAHGRYDTRILLKECQSLAAAGYDVSLIVNDSKQDEVFGGVKIVSTGFAPGNRYERMVLSRKYIKEQVVKVDADIYHLHDPELLYLVKFLHKRGKKVIFDSHEDYVSTIIEKDWIAKGLRKFIVKAYEKYEHDVISMADGAVVCYHWTQDRYVKCNDNVEMVLNFPVVRDDYKPAEISFDENAIGYAGGISEQWCHEDIMEALKILDGVKYKLAGNLTGPYGERLKSRSEFERFVEYKGKLPQHEVNNVIYSKSFAGVALLDYISQCKGTIGNLSNTKFFECMYAGVPLICTDFKLWKEIVDEEKCGICVNPHDPQQIADAVSYLKEHPEEARQMGINGYNAIINKYNWDKEKEKLLALYSRIV